MIQDTEDIVVKGWCTMLSENGVNLYTYLERDQRLINHQLVYRLRRNGWFDPDTDKQIRDGAGWRAIYPLLTTTKMPLFHLARSHDNLDKGKLHNWVLRE